RAGDDARRQLRAVLPGPDRVTDRFLDRLGEPVELADVEIHPAHRILRRALGDQHHYGLDDAGVADETAAGLDDGCRNAVAEVPAQRTEDRLAVGVELGRLARVARREAAAEVDHGERDAALGAGAEDRRGRRQRPVPGFHVVLLRADVERDAVRHQAEPVRLLEDVGRIFRLAAEFPRQGPFRARAVAMDAADHARAGRGARHFFDLRLAVDREQRDAEPVGPRDLALLLDGVAVGDALGAFACGQHRLGLAARG